LLHAQLSYVNKDDITDFTKCISSIEQRAKVARELGIDQCIKYGVREGARNSSVQGKAVNAIVGATFIDSGRDIVMAFKMIFRLGYVLIILLTQQWQADLYLFL
jgi:hypothetical protein